MERPIIRVGPGTTSQQITTIVTSTGDFTPSLYTRLDYCRRFSESFHDISSDVHPSTRYTKPEYLALDRSRSDECVNLDDMTTTLEVTTTMLTSSNGICFFVSCRYTMCDISVMSTTAVVTSTTELLSTMHSTTIAMTSTIRLGIRSSFPNVIDRAGEK